MTRSAIRVTAGALGLIVGFSGIQHGFYEMLQGNSRPAGVMISSYGPPCQPEMVWHLCEPAMTVIPNFFWTGIASMIAGLIVMIWAAGFVQRQYGGVVLLLLSILQLLVGGGLIPPVIGIIAGLVGIRVGRPLPWWRARSGGTSMRFLARVWPWSLGAFAVCLFGQYPVGYFFNDFLMQSGLLTLGLILGWLVLSILGAFAHDSQSCDGHRAAA